MALPALDAAGIYPIAKSVFEQHTAGFGIIRNQETRREGWTSIAYLRQLYELFESACDYFADLIDPQWRKMIIHRIMAEALKPFNLQPDYVIQQACGVGTDYAEAIDFAIELGAKIEYPDLEEIRANAVELIRQVLAQKMPANFYELGGDDNHQLRPRVRAIAQRYQIELPEEKELWQREVTKILLELEDAYGSKETAVAENRAIFGMAKLKKQTSDAIARIKNAVETLGTDILPQGIDNIATIENNFSTRMSGIDVKDFMNGYYSDLNRLKNAVTRNDFNNVASAQMHLGYLLERNKAKIVELRLDAELAAQIRFVNEQIAELAGEMSKDPEQSRKLVNWILGWTSIRGALRYFLGQLERLGATTQA